VAFPQWSELGFEMKRFGARLIRGATFEGFLDGGTRAVAGFHPGSEQKNEAQEDWCFVCTYGATGR